MTILENNLHLKPRQTRGTELFRFRNYVALTVVSVGALIGIAFQYSPIAKSFLERHVKYMREHEPASPLEITSKSPADILMDFKDSFDNKKYEI